MPEIMRTRDVIVFFKDATFTVDVTAQAAAEGWVGGQAFNWTASTDDRLVVTKSDGLAAGFALWGSDESSDAFTATTKNQPSYHYVVLAAGGWIMSTANYERYTYASRAHGGPLVPIRYSASDRLLFSLRGLFTTEDEWSASSDARGSNGNIYGVVTQRPTAERNWHLGVQVII
jgi:hypothetical protein